MSVSRVLPGVISCRILLATRHSKNPSLESKRTLVGREPQRYSIWAVVVRLEATRYEVTVRATAIDHPGHGGTFVERAECTSARDAKERQIAMTRELSARLAAQGHSVIEVNLGDGPTS